MNSLNLVHVLRRWWWVTVLAAAATVAATLFFTSKLTPLYEARAMLVVGPSDKIDDLDEFARSASALNRSVIATYGKLPATRVVQARAKAQLNLTPEVALLYQHNTVIVPDTNILEVRVEGPDPKVCAAMANAIAQHARDYQREFYDIFALRILDPATPPSIPVWPDTPRALGMGGVIGLLLGLGLSFLGEYLRRQKLPARELVEAQAGAQVNAWQR